jgi:hypothetical protein
MDHSIVRFQGGPIAAKPNACLSPSAPAKSSRNRKVMSALAFADWAPYPIFPNSSRPISMRRISLVPAPIS